MTKRKKKFNVKNYTADLGIGDRASFYRNVKDIAVSIAAQPQYEIFESAIAACGVDLYNRSVTELRFLKNGREVIEAATVDAIGTRKEQFIPVNAPDRNSRILVKMLADLGFDHDTYYVLGIEYALNEDNEKVLMIESKPKVN